MSGNCYFCQLCINAPAYCSFDSLYSHINLVHCNDPSFKLRCELTPQCGSIYRTLPSYKSHIYKYHRELISKSLDKEDIFSPSNDNLNNTFTFSYADDDCTSEHESDNNNNEDFQSSNEWEEEIEVDYPLLTQTILEHDEEPFNMKKFQKFYTGFLLELRENHLLSQNIITSITSNFSLLFNIVLKMIKSTASGENAAKTAVVSVIKVEEIINEIVRTIEGAAKYEYQFIKSCKEFFQYEEPQKINLNESGDCGYIIPIAKSIQNFLNKPDVIDLLIQNTNETISTTKKDNDLLLTYRDGKAAATNQSLEKNTNSFLLQLYSDEVGITNPIGPKKDEKKLLLFYYILDDLPPIIRSLLSSIGLVGICLSKLLINRSHRRIYFEAMIKGLNELQTKGLTLSTCNGRFYFAFDFIAADNLAAHDLGGFQKNFNNGYFCRMCYISYDYKNIPLTALSFLLRSEASHEIHVNQVLQSNKSVCGVAGRSDFSNLIAFHPVKSLPFDIMHDLSEGN
jgi:hypothetical protein